MRIIQYSTSQGVPHQSMEEEFLYHKRGPEWWYATGYMTDDDGKLFTYQFTLAKIRIFGIKFNILMTAVTDFETRLHHYAQQAIFFERDIIVTPNRVGVDGRAEMTFEKENLGLNMAGRNYKLALDLNVVKPAVWHCDDGVLKMGIDNQWTYYWSYTNLAVSGNLVLDGKDHKVTGKGWFDKQGGPFNPVNRRTSWEWFSLRFFDDEEMMLFSFPQDGYQDGTFIDKAGNHQRFNDYKITSLSWTEAAGKKFSFGWKLETKRLKDGEYTIVPKIDGQVNMFYFELLAEIKNQDGQIVGYCVVELLPNPLDAFARTQ